MERGMFGRSRSKRTKRLPYKNLDQIDQNPSKMMPSTLSSITLHKPSMETSTRRDQYWLVAPISKEINTHKNNLAGIHNNSINGSLYWLNFLNRNKSSQRDGLSSFAKIYLSWKEAKWGFFICLESLLSKKNGITFVKKTIKQIKQLKQIKITLKMFWN